MRTTITLVASITLSLFLAEGLLRLTGNQPWSYKRFRIDEPTMHEPDPVLGWRNKTGDYLLAPYDPTGAPIQITFRDDGQRRTRIDSVDPDSILGQIVLVGGSFTQGWAISDSATYAWKLQQKYPSMEVLNYGTGAYGTYQSLLVLERELPRLASPRIVLYGFIDHHEARNVAPESWLRILSLYSRRGHVKAPFATLDDNGRIVRHAPEGYLSLPLRESSALVALVERAYMQTVTRGRYEQRAPVTEAILLEMDRLCKEHHAALYVVLLNATRGVARHYEDFCDKNGIQWIDCLFPLTKEMMVPGEGHPNGRMNTMWADRIAEALEDRTKQLR